MRSTSRPADESTRSLFRGNVLWLSVVSFLNDAASEMIYPLLPMFLVGTLGAGPAFLGTIEGIAESASSFLKLVSGRVSDRFRRRKPLVLAGYTIACAVRPLIAVVTLPWQVLAVRFSDRLGKGVRSAPRDALLAESVPAAVRGRAFGLHRAADHAGAVVGPVAASLLLLAFANDMRPVFALAIVPGILVVVTLVLRVRETSPQAAASDPAVVTPAEPGSVESRIAFRRYLFVLGLFTLGNATDAFLLLRANALGVAAALVPLLWGAHHVSKMFWSVVGGITADRFGPRRAIVTGWIVYAATYAGFAFASRAWQVWALFLVYGLFYGLTEAPEKALVARLARSGRGGSAFGAYHATIGFAALPASIVFGMIWQRFGAPAAFLTGASLALAAALLLPILVAPPRSDPATVIS
jgi:MFS family permease